MRYIRIVGTVVIITLGAFIIMTYISVSSTSDMFRTCEILENPDTEAMDFRKYDSVRVVASTLYRSTALKVWMQGEQYRKAWATPVRLPVVYLDTLYGGSEIVEEGGGKQTHSLKIMDSSGFVHSMRSINKDTEKLIPGLARKLGLENIVVDGISAQHPYAAPVVAKLADALDILHTDPKAVFLPKQETLGKYNMKYGNRIFLLERETEGGPNWTRFDDVIEIVDTDDLQQSKKKHGGNLRINENALVRSRLFDILIGDWDRHAKQWGWVVRRQNGGYLAEPLPGDRDNAFFRIEGIIPTLLANKNILPGLQSFEGQIDYMEGLVMPFDVYFLKHCKKNVFERQAKFLQKHLTDSVLESAFAIWPDTIRRTDGPKIKSSIKERRANLKEIALEFHKILEEMPLLSEPLKGSEDIVLDNGLLGCFDCEWAE